MSKHKMKFFLICLKGVTKENPFGCVFEGNWETFWRQCTWSGMNFSSLYKVEHYGCRWNLNMKYLSNVRYISKLKYTTKSLMAISHKLFIYQWCLLYFSPWRTPKLFIGIFKACWVKNMRTSTCLSTRNASRSTSCRGTQSEELRILKTQSKSGCFHSFIYYLTTNICIPDIICFTLQYHVWIPC